MPHPPIETSITQDWVRAQKDGDDGIISVGGLAHRIGTFGSSSPKPGRLTLAKIVELMRRERNESPQELASRAGVNLESIVALERADWPNPGASVIESVAAALEVDPVPMLELGGFNRSQRSELGDVAVEFTARLEPLKPLEPEEIDALGWLRQHAFKLPERTKAG